MSRSFLRFARAAVSAAVVVSVAALPTGAVGQTPPSPRTQSAAADTSPATWAPWLLASPDQFRLQAPPAAGSRSTKRDLRELRQLQKERTPKIKRRIKRWNEGAVSLRWTEVTLDMIQKVKQRPPIAARNFALFQTALYDALIAAYDSREAYTRLSPWKADKRIKPLLKPEGTSYPPVEAVLAGAAETMLIYLVPEEPEKTFHRLAAKAVKTRLWAGANYRSDVKRGRKLGNAVAALFIERGENDGHTNTEVSNPRPEGEAYWDPTAPGFEANTGGPVGTWLPWILSSPDEARVGSGIPPPPEYGSELFMQEVNEVLEGQENLTEDEGQIAQFWDDGPGTYTPSGHWIDIGKDLAIEYDTDTEQTVRIFSILATTLNDAAIAGFEAKYNWWSIRPITVIRRLCDEGTRLCSKAELEADPTLATYPDWLPHLLTPPFPSYPGGHSTFSGSAGEVLAHYFPEAADLVRQEAEQAAISRFYGGIHFHSDNNEGLVLGRWVGTKAVTLPQAGA